MAETARVKLVTVIAPTEFQDRLGSALLRLGAGGYTMSKVDGRGQSGQRKRSIFEIGNIRLEAIVSHAQATAILAHMAGEAENIHMVAFAQDVEAVPHKHFV